MTLDRTHYEALMEARIFDPQSLVKALVSRRRRTIAGSDGRLVIVAADHTARGKISLGSDPLAMADRYKTCLRCGLEREVKRRAKREDAK